jgi:excisionase family DNA binding protein
MSIQSTGLGDAERGAGLLNSPKWANHNTFTVPEAAEILRISKWAAYEAAKKKKLAVIWIGRRCLVPRRSLEALLSAPAAAPSPIAATSAQLATTDSAAV